MNGPVIQVVTISYTSPVHACCEAAGVDVLL
jgi:hypothetical protein